MAQKKQKKLTEEMQELLNEIEDDPQLQENEELSEEEALMLQNDMIKQANIEERKIRASEAERGGTKANPGKYITFSLAGENYGLYILSVKEIIGMMNITRVPRTPDFVRGVINLRGKVHPVIDLRKRFGLEPKEDDARTPIIIVEINHSNGLQHLGIVVDSVSEVINVEKDDIENTPSFGVDLETDFILGLAKIENKVITLLDIDQILTSRQLVMLQDADSKKK
jgi:purine-binding chemotaxis protein CheW